MLHTILKNQPALIIRKSAKAMGSPIDNSVSDANLLKIMNYVITEAAKYNLVLDEFDLLERTVAYVIFETSDSKLFGYEFANQNLERWLRNKRNGVE